MFKGPSSLLWGITFLNLVIWCADLVFAQSSTCVDSGNQPVSLNYSLLEFGRFLVRTNSPPTAPAGCFLRVLDKSGTAISVVSGSPLPPCDTPFVFDMESSVNVMFHYNQQYSFQLIGLDLHRSTLCTSQILQLTIASPVILSMVPSLSRVDGESISITFSSSVTVGLCEISLVGYKGVNLSPTPVKRGPCSSYFTFNSDNQAVAMRPGDSVVISWSYYEDGVTLTYSSPSPINLGSIPSYFTCSQSLSVIRVQSEVSFVAITSPTPMQGKCSLVISSCTSPSYTPTIPFTACPQYAVLSLSSLSLTTSPTTCTVYWQYEYNGVTCKEPQNTISVTLREQCSLVSVPVSIDNTLSVKFVFQATNPMDCVARLLSCGTTQFDPPLQHRISNCISGTSIVTFTSIDTAELINGVSCNLDFLRVPNGDLVSSSSYSCHTDPVSFRVGPPTPGWVTSVAETTLIYNGNGCVSLSWDQYTTNKVNCYGIDRFDSQSGEWLNIQSCVKSQTLNDCLPTDLSVNYQYRVKVFVADRGWTSSYLLSENFQIASFLFPQAPSWLSPAFTDGIESTFSSVQFPPLTILSNDNSKFHFFVAKLVPRCKSDLASGNTIVVPLEIGDLGYIAPSASLSTPTFTYTFAADQSSPGRYPLATVMFANPYVPKGKYSLVIYSLQPGGLVGQYYATPMFVDLVDTKYESVDFSGPVQSPVVNWPFAPLNIVEQMSIRWTGFLEPKYAEKTVFRIETFGRIKLWIDDNLVIDQFESPCSLGICTSAPIQLRPSPWIPQGDLSTRLKLFHSIRLDYVVTSDLDSSPQNPEIVLKWSSVSLPLETIPVTNLFGAKTLSIFTNNPERFPLISVIPGPTDYATSTLIGPGTAVGAGISTELSIQTRDSSGQKTEGNCFEIFLAKFRLKSNPTIVVEAKSLDAGGSLCGGQYRVPVTFTIAGDYTVAVTDFASGTLLEGSPGTILHVVAGPPTNIGSDITFGPDTVIKSISESRVYFSLLDQFGQSLDGSDLSQPLPHINILPEWLYDAEALVRLGGAQFSDNTERGKISSTLPVVIGWDNSREKFYGTISFPQSGTVRVKVRIGDAEASIVSSETVVVANEGYFDSTKSVVVPSIQPLPLKIVAGYPLSFKVQLRDQNMNVLQSFPTNHMDVFVELIRADNPQIVDSRVCTPSVTLGVFDCAPSLNVAGEILVNITVNGKPTRLIMDQFLSPNSMVDGLFGIQVVHADLEPSLTVWSNLPPVLRKDVSHETIFTFYDQFGNDLGDDVHDFRSVKVEFIKTDASVVYTETAVEFRDGKVRMYLKPPVASPNDPGNVNYPGFSLRLTVAGQIVNPFGTLNLVRVLRGGAEANEITCTTNPATQVTAGTAVMSTCIGGGLEGVSTEFLTLVFGDTQSAFVSGTNMYTATIGPTIPGTYSVHATLAQRGGLEGRYFIDPDFTTVIPPSPSGIESSFTRVDSILEFDFGDSILVEHAVAQSVEWTGFIEPPGTVSIRFKLVASGGVRFSLGGVFLYDSIDNGGRVDTVIDTALTGGVLSPVSIRYRPGQGGPKFSLQWSYPNINGSPIPIPPRALLRNVVIPSSLVTSYTVLASVISSVSKVTFTATAFKNGIFSFIINAIDAYGNHLDSASSCLSGSSFPSCLFQITTEPSTAIIGSPSVTYVSGGQYTVQFTFGNVNAVLLHVKLALAGGQYAELTGSPFTIDVL